MFYADLRQKNVPVEKMTARASYIMYVCFIYLTLYACPLYIRLIFEFLVQTVPRAVFYFFCPPVIWLVCLYLYLKITRS